MRLLLHRGNNVSPLSELQAAVLLPQLEKLDFRNRHRAANVSVLETELKEIPGISPFLNRAPCRPAHYKLGLHYDTGKFGLSREILIRAIRAEGVALDEGFAALHAGRSPARYRSPGNLRESERAHLGAIILHHPVLLGNADDVNMVVRAFQKVYANPERLRDS
jgi:dTDP-4-amino-4,6-dideoxygalactose transaminase